VEGCCSHPASSNLLTTPIELPRFNSLHSHNGEKRYCWSTLPWRHVWRIPSTPKITDFWDIASWWWEAVRTSETSVYFEITQCYIPERSHLLVEGCCSHPASSNLLTTPIELPRFNSWHSHNG
jgi:hypothetical protein